VSCQQGIGFQVRWRTGQRDRGEQGIGPTPWTIDPEPRGGDRHSVALGFRVHSLSRVYGLGGVEDSNLFSRL